MSQQPCQRRQAFRELNANEDLERGQKRLKRRAVQTKLQKLAEWLKDSEVTDDLDIEKSTFDEILDSANKISEEASMPREQLLDAGLLEKLSQCALKQVKLCAQADGHSPSDFVHGLLRQFSITGVGEADGEEGPSEHSFDWARLGLEHAVKFLRPAVTFGTMVGPMSAEAPKAKVRQGQKRVRERLTGEKVTPVEVDADGGTPGAVDQATENKVLALTKAFKKPKNGCKAVPVLPLVIDPESFTTTVENVFALSFLVKEGKCELSAVQSNGEPSPLQRIVAEFRPGVSDEDRARRRCEYDQFILRVDYSDWLKLRHSAHHAS